MDERDHTRHSIEQTRARMSEIADELSRRASMGYVKQRARNLAQQKTGALVHGVKERPILIGLMACGIGVASFFLFGGDRARRSRHALKGFAFRGARLVKEGTTAAAKTY